jgi:hypothetical protein
MKAKISGMGGHRAAGCRLHAAGEKFVNRPNVFSNVVLLPYCVMYGMDKYAQGYSKFDER